MPQFIKCLAITACFFTNYLFLNITAHESNVLNHFSTLNKWAGFLFLFLTIYNKSVWFGLGIFNIKFLIRPKISVVCG